MSSQAKVSILFICMGNICRSPTAEGVFRSLLRERGLEGRVAVDSAGTHAYHVGKAPDPRSQQAARRRDIDLSDLRARVVSADDFDRFDLVLVMDDANLEQVRRICPPERSERLRRLLDFAPELGRTEVPDPYYGGEQGFEEVLDLVTAAGEGLLAYLEEQGRI